MMASAMRLKVYANALFKEGFIEKEYTQNRHVVRIPSRC